MSDIDMSQPIVDLNEKTKLKSPFKRFLRLLLTKKFWTNFIGKFFLYTMLTDFALVFILPIAFMIITGIENPLDYADSAVTWIPRRALFTELMKVGLEALDYGNTFWYTLKIVGLCTLGHVISGMLTGYALGRLKFMGRGLVFAFVLLTLIVPSQALTTYLYQAYILLMPDAPEIYRIIVPCFFGLGLNGGLFIFIFRQVYAGLPKELEEAAMIDGCSIFQTFTKIMLPLGTGAMLVTIVLSFVWHWNDLYEPIIYITIVEREKPMLMSMRMYQLFILRSQPFGDGYKVDIGMDTPIQNIGLQADMWCTFVSLVPLLIMYILIQKRFMESVASSGIKG